MHDNHPLVNEFVEDCAREFLRRDPDIYFTSLTIDVIEVKEEYSTINVDAYDEISLIVRRLQVREYPNLRFQFV